jgi:hypothetical protein
MFGKKHDSNDAETRYTDEAGSSAKMLRRTDPMAAAYASGARIRTGPNA